MRVFLKGQMRQFIAVFYYADGDTTDGVYSACSMDEACAKAEDDAKTMWNIVGIKIGLMPDDGNHVDE